MYFLFRAVHLCCGDPRVRDILNIGSARCRIDSESCRIEAHFSSMYRVSAIEPAADDFFSSACCCGSSAGPVRGIRSAPEDTGCTSVAGPTDSRAHIAGVLSHRPRYQDAARKARSYPRRGRTSLFEGRHDLSRLDRATRISLDGRPAMPAAIRRAEGVTATDEFSSG